MGGGMVEPEQCAADLILARRYPSDIPAGAWCRGLNGMLASPSICFVVQRSSIATSDCRIELGKLAEWPEDPLICFFDT